MRNIAQVEQVTALLGNATSWGPIEVVATTGSTNADLASLAREGAAAGRVLIAREQTAGRGRLDRSWASPPDSSLSMSLLLQPEPSFERWGWLSLLAGLAVEAALRELAPAGIDIELKWPNDVLLNGKKVCGILAERIEHSSGAKAVVGMGINLLLTESELPVPTATSLLLAGFDVDPNQVAAAVLRQFEAYYFNWQQTGSLRAQYQARCASIGTQLSITLAPDRVVHGRGHAVDELGRLQVATPTGITTYAVGDVVHARMNR